MAKLKRTTITNITFVSEVEVTRACKIDVLKYLVDNKSHDTYHWDQLPNEITLKVFSYLDTIELLRMATVCTSWRDLIHTTPSLWRNIHLVLSCNWKSQKNKKTFLCAQQFGMNFRKLSVSCSHDHKTGICRFLAIDFRKLLLSLHQTSLTSIKITDLQLQGALMSTVKNITQSLTRILSRSDRLQSFKMSSAQFTFEEGITVLDTVFSVSRGTLETFYIDIFFREPLLGYLWNEQDKLTNGILSLTRLTKLGIDYRHLTDDFLTALSRSHAGQLKILKIVAQHLHNDFYNYQVKLATNSWLTLTGSCPELKLAFMIDGYTLALIGSLMKILDQVMPIYKIKLMLELGYYDDLNSSRFKNVLNEITANFRNTLVKLEIEHSRRTGKIDAAFLDLVRNCQRLTYIKATAYFSDPETERIALELVQARRRQQEMSESQELPNKRAKLTRADGPGSDPA
ncbi:F-box only protein 39-like [Physella acuta]|uniref:F-box only protein 39-like n=1 Tax=Physella acuta TaxID=109671 RepID=UPI0027DDE5DB|nr:F-box only protein 39-like [Physella acuta]